VYQPLFKLDAGEAGQPPANALTGFEALVRWKHPGGNTLQPMAFLPIAEETGLMLQVSDFVLHCACRQLRQWQQSSPELAELTMSINLSAHDLAHPALVARVSQAIVEAGLRPEHLTLELTEDILMSDISGAGSTLRKAVVAEGIETADQVQQLRELGCELGQGFHLSTPLSEQAANDWLAARRAPLH